MNYLFIDTETTGLPADFNAPATDIDNWPRMVQYGYILCNEKRKIIETGSHIIKPEGFSIPEQATAIHGITTEEAMEKGLDYEDAMNRLLKLTRKADVIVGHNISFDEKIIDAEIYRFKGKTVCDKKDRICTMKSSKEFCGLGKYPKLIELHNILFKKGFDGAHDAMNDIRATFNCFWKLVDKKVIPQPKPQKRQGPSL